MMNFTIRCYSFLEDDNMNNIGIAEKQSIVGSRHVGLLGAGKMAQAIAKGLLSSGESSLHICLVF